MNRRTAIAAIISVVAAPIAAAPEPGYIPTDPTKPGDAGFLGKRDKSCRRKKRRAKRAMRAAE